MPDDFDAEIDAALAAPSDDFDAEIDAALAAPVPPKVVAGPSPSSIDVTPTPVDSWYKTFLRGAARNVTGNLARDLQDNTLGRRESPEGIPATYEDSTQTTRDGIPATIAGTQQGESLESDWRRMVRERPVVAALGQAVGSVPAAAAAALGGAGLGAAAAGTAGIGGPLGALASSVGSSLGGAVGGGALLAAQELASKEGNIADRSASVAADIKENPKTTAALLAAPIAGDIVAPIVGPAIKNFGAKIGGKLVDAGNESLARLFLTAPQRSKMIDSKGANAVRNIGAAAREAGLTKGRTWLDKLTPTSAARVAENADAAVSREGKAVKDLENLIMDAPGENNEVVRHTEVDVDPIVSKLEAERDEAAASWDTTSEADARKIQKQIDMLKPPAEEVVQVQGQIVRPPPLPVKTPPPLPAPTQHALPIEAGAVPPPSPQLPLFGGEKIAPPPSPVAAPVTPQVPPPPAPVGTQASLPFPTSQAELPLPPSQTALDLPQTAVPAPVPPAQVPISDATLGTNVSLPQSAPAQRLPDPAWLPPTPPAPPVPVQTALPPAQLGLPDVPRVGALEPMTPHAELPGPTPPPLPSEIYPQNPTATQGTLPYTSAGVQEPLPLGLESGAFPPPAPSTPFIDPATGPRPPIQWTDTAPPIPQSKGPGAQITELPPRDATLSPRRTLEGLIRTKRRMSNKLNWGKSQFGSPTDYANDLSQKLTVREMKDLLTRTLERQADQGFVDPATVAAYKQANKNFSTAATVINPATAMAERAKDGIGVKDIVAGAVTGPAGLITTQLAKGGRPRGIAQGTLNNLGRASTFLSEQAAKLPAAGQNALNAGATNVAAQSPIEQAAARKPDAPTNVIEQDANQSIKDAFYKVFLK